jgi:hypothetical protein
MQHTELMRNKPRRNKYQQTGDDNAEYEKFHAVLLSVIIHPATAVKHLRPELHGANKRLHNELL